MYEAPPWQFPIEVQLGMPADPEDPDPQTSGSLDPEPDPIGSDPRIQAPPCEKGVAPQITANFPKKL